MSDAEEQQEPNELDLDAEMVKDLDVGDEQAGRLRGGQSYGASSPGPTHKPG